MDTSLDASPTAPQLTDDLIASGANGFLFEGADGGVAGLGESARLEIDIVNGLGSALDEVRRFVARNAVGDQPVFVRIPFADDQPVVAVLPLTYVWGTSPVGTSSAPSSRHLTVESKPSAGQWVDAVEKCIKRLDDAGLTKVVLARQLLVTAETPFSVLTILRTLKHRYPSAYCYFMDGLIGASPELLISKDGTRVSARPMAGTVSRGVDAQADEAARSYLLQSSKDRDEHRILVDDLRAAISPYCGDLSVPDEPEIVSLANVHHFASPLVGHLLPNSEVDVLTLLANVHPTPAVGGHPSEMALTVIKELESASRGYYAGAIGWVNAAGDGHFAIALRGAQLDGNQALLTAGAGILKDSDPEAELRETDAKFAVMLEALAKS